MSKENYDLYFNLNFGTEILSSLIANEHRKGKKKKGIKGSLQYLDGQCRINHEYNNYHALNQWTRRKKNCIHVLSRQTLI